MVVGCIAAILAWAIVEPYFDDVYYIQGGSESCVLVSGCYYFLYSLQFGYIVIFIREPRLRGVFLGW